MGSLKLCQCSRPREGGEMRLSWKPAVSKSQCQPAWVSAPAMSILTYTLFSSASQGPLLLRSRMTSFTTFLLISYFIIFCLSHRSLKEEVNEQVVFPSLPWFLWVGVSFAKLFMHYLWHYNAVYCMPEYFTFFLLFLRTALLMFSNHVNNSCK